MRWMYTVVHCMVHRLHVREVDEPHCMLVLLCLNIALDYHATF